MAIIVFIKIKRRRCELSEHKGVIDLEQGFKEVLSGVHNHRSGSFFTAPIMYCLAKQMKAKHILEVGTCNGSAAFWLSHAAKENGGKYFGMEIDQGRVTGLDRLMSRFDLNYQLWCMDSREMTDTFIKENIGGIDIAYLDGDHSMEAIWHEITTIWPNLRGSGSGYVFIHDIYTDSKEGWAKVKANYEETFEIKAGFGMGIVRKV